jgi:uncharacterized membrane protein YphA (DoxX/SURF4 family)
MRFIRFFSRVFLGIVFVFSGFVKAVDPMGSAYKFSDYFHAFGLEFLDGISVPLAIFLSAFEMVLGLALLLGYQKKKTYWALLFFMGFFTILTFILALTNPVSDCGCFGDAIILTNWETFFKNIVFMVFVLLLFSSRKRVKNILDERIERWVLVFLFAAGSGFSVYTLRHLPILDFRPYDIGTFIPDEMEIPEDAPRDEYKTILYYKNLKTDETEEFTIENYPEDTVNYAFLTSESQLVRKGYEPPIHDFGLMDPNGKDITDEVLAFSGYTLLMVSHDLEKADMDALHQGNNWSKLELFAGDFRFIPITASAGSVVEDIAATAGVEYNFYGGDEIMLKTMVRSNPGFLMLKNGTIVSKWGYRDFPSFHEWSSDWPELIEQYAQAQDPDIFQLIEEGFVEDIQYNLIEFDRVANSLMLEWNMKQRDRCRWELFILILVIVLMSTAFLPTRKTRGRV